MGRNKAGVAVCGQKLTRGIIGEDWSNTQLHERGMLMQRDAIPVARQAQERENDLERMSLLLLLLLTLGGLPGDYLPREEVSKSVFT